MRRFFRSGRRAQLSRRMFLGGAGVVVALPIFESLIGERAYADDAFPARTLFYYLPNGINMADWTPNAVGAGYDLPAILAPLAPLQQKINVITGLSNVPAQPDGAGDHAGGTSGFLTAAHANKSETDIQLGISVDQVIANAVGGDTAIPSMQIGIDGGASTGGCDSGYSCAYTRNISWASATQPLPKASSTHVVFNQIFGGLDPAATAAEQQKRREYRLSVLNYVNDEANALKVRLNHLDKAKLDEYLSGISDLEKRINGPAPSCDPVGEPNNNPGLVEKIKIMSDLMVLAMRCDTTRVISFMQANAGSNRFYDFLPNIVDEHHSLSHHSGDPAKIAQLTTIDTWEITMFMYLLEKMNNVTEGTGTLLDHSQVFLSSELEDGHAHHHRNLPILLAGGCHDAYTTGRHIRYFDVPDQNGPPIANLFISMMAAVGASADAFGETGTGPLGQLKV